MLLLLLLVITRLLPRDGGMAEDHGAPEAGKLPRVWTRGRRETESPKSERRKGSIAGQCRTRRQMSWDECPQQPARWCSGESVRIAVGRPGVHSLSRVIPKDFK